MKIEDPRCIENIDSELCILIVISSNALVLFKILLGVIMIPSQELRTIRILSIYVVLQHCVMGARKGV